MAQHTHLLIDSAESIVRDGATIKGGDADARPWTVRLRSCHGGKSQGVHVVEIDNGAMCIDVLPTRGMGIWRVRRGEKTLGWRPPICDPVHPSFVPLMEPAGLGWLDGFNELLARCGLESNGPPEFDDAGRLLRPLHGRISNTPAGRVELIVDEDAGELTLRGVVEEARMFFQSLRLTTTITTKFGSNEFSWTDEVENFGGRDATLQMLYHFNIGLPLLQAGARVVAPVATVAPSTQVAAEEGVETWNIMPPPRPTSSEQVYLLDLAANTAGDTRVMVSGLKDDEAVSLRFNKRTLPCFTVWRNSLAEVEGYVLGIEPATNYPNARAFEQQQGRTIALKPGEKWRNAVTATWHTDRDAIAQETNVISAIQADHQPNFATSPLPHWSANA